MIIRNHPVTGLCQITTYSYIDFGALYVKNVDFPKKVAYKARHVRKTEI